MEYYCPFAVHFSFEYSLSQVGRPDDYFTSRPIVCCTQQHVAPALYATDASRMIPQHGSRC
eukprot:5251805-Heterocapsa_arctica.AAC.1